jgi:hypothetical protein
MSLFIQKFIALILYALMICARYVAELSDVKTTLRIASANRISLFARLVMLP